jgi:D-glycero-alpha-D-manno-heptose 1-phosphate guanylyltransferase
MECIILAGGLGTRLSGVVQDVPKCMAPVAGEPFLQHVLHFLEEQFVDHVIFSLGYKSEIVIEWLRQKAFTFKTSWVLEKEPRGTGGGIKLALHKSKEHQVFVLNGDTLFKTDLRAMQSAIKPDSKAMLALKPMQQFDRYGSVLINEEGIITAFEEKRAVEEGLINGGVYLINKALADLNSMPDAFSFEKNFLETQAPGALQGFVSDGYFIDIGIPEDYYRAQQELA